MLNIQEMMASRCKLIDPDHALPDREKVIELLPKHAIFENHPNDFKTELDEGEFEQVQFALGCFWGAERKFWKTPGVIFTAVGYAGGHTKNPSYEDVCSGKTAHTEVVWIVFDPKLVSLEELLVVFWENHDPTQGMRQGNDVGSQYRSAIYYFDDSRARTAKKNTADLIEETRLAYQALLNKNDHDLITTEVKPAGEFYCAESYHQQYLHKNPNGYCGLGGTGVSYSGKSC